MFTDVPNFNFIVSQTPPSDIVSLLNDLFAQFDRLLQINKVEAMCFTIHLCAFMCVYTGVQSRRY
jgi:hypothetical protein